MAAQYLQDVRAHLSEEDFADFMEVLQGHAAGRYSDDVVRQYGDVFFAAAPQLKARLTSLVPEVSEGTPHRRTCPPSLARTAHSVLVLALLIHLTQADEEDEQTSRRDGPRTAAAPPAPREDEL